MVDVVDYEVLPKQNNYPVHALGLDFFLLDTSNISRYTFNRKLPNYLDLDFTRHMFPVIPI